MDHLIGRMRGSASYYGHLKEIRLNAWSALTSVPLTKKRNMKHYSGHDLTKVAGAMSVVIYCDSQVVTNQVNGDYECKGERMKRYLDQVK